MFEAVAKLFANDRGALSPDYRAEVVISTVTAAAPFTIADGANTCSGQSIALKKTCSFYVEFSPTTVGAASGGISVTYNGTSPAVALTGKGQ
jgi:hypothetical protein